MPGAEFLELEQDGQDNLPEVAENRKRQRWAEAKAFEYSNDQS